MVDEPWAQIEVKRHSAFCRQSVELIDFEAGDPFNDTSFIISVRRFLVHTPVLTPRRDTVADRMVIPCGGVGQPRFST